MLCNGVSEADKSISCDEYYLVVPAWSGDIASPTSPLPHDLFCSCWLLIKGLDLFQWHLSLTLYSSSTELACHIVRSFPIMTLSVYEAHQKDTQMSGQIPFDMTLNSHILLTNGR